MDIEDLIVLGIVGVIGYFLLTQAGVIPPIPIGSGSSPGPYPTPSGTNGGSQPMPSPQPSGAPVSNDVNILARTMYGEARGEGSSGMSAVANVVMNRYNQGTFPGAGSVAGICQAPMQFSCWNMNDPNYNTITSVTASDPVFAQALQIASQAVAGGLPDATGGATYYHDTSIQTPSSWLAAGYQETTQIGRLVFFMNPAQAVA